METARVQVRASGNLQLPLLVGLVEADEGPGTLGSLPGLLHAAALVAWSDGSSGSGSGSRSNSTGGPDDRAPTKGLSKKGAHGPRSFSATSWHSPCVVSCVVCVVQR